MRLDEFDYYLPPERIAQEPTEPRDSSRLLVVKRGNEFFEHRRFWDLPSYLEAGDVLVLNDTRVIPARLRLRRADTGGKVELLLLHPLGEATPGEAEWEVLGRPARRLRSGARLVADGGELSAEVRETAPEGVRRVRLKWDPGVSLNEMLARVGEVPLPPYIHRSLEDGERYQTVYARHPGSAAAPTAGLHFTPRLLQAVTARGCALAYLTLHVGPGTFRPLREETVEESVLHAEWYEVGEELARTVNGARMHGGRVVAVGTTVVRALETAAAPEGTLLPGTGWTRLFIYPGYCFRCVDAMVTNFHLPRSSLLLLVAAFAGRETIMRAYREAIDREYRFYSLGDAMLIL